MTLESTGIFSPGLTITTSPFVSNSTGTSDSIPFFLTIAIFGCSSRSFLMVDAAFPLVLLSRYFPSKMNVITIAVAS